MRFSAITAAFLATLAIGPAPVRAQDDLVGFDRASFGKAVLNRKQAAGAGGNGDMVFELSVGDYNNEPITTYSRESVFAKMGLSVGRLDILTDNGVFPCTAFIVDKKHILTNYHCVPGILDNERAGATRIDSVMFVAGYIEAGIEENTKKYTVIPTPVEAYEDLDYAVLEVIGNPSSEYGTLTLAAHTPADGDPYWVIGHPMGEAQRISREKCRANKPALSGHQLLHTCDTLPGNSGSPVIDASLRAVVGLHHAGSRKDSVNFAIPMTEILNRSKVLVAAVGDDGPRPDPGPNPGPAPAPELAICDEMYTEAKSLDSCPAYEVYLSQCGEHRYAPFAQATLNAQCTAPDPGPEPEPEQPQTADPLRPWCVSSFLSDAQKTICADAYLAGLDEELQSAYEAQSHVGSAELLTWEREGRDACGTDGRCLSREMVDYITYLATPPQVDPDPEPDPDPTPLMRRPWCASNNLNATEYAICDSAYLAGLDAEMERVYGGQSHASASDQRAWLTTRNACGSDSSCISRAILDRIAYLQNPPADPQPESGSQRVPGSYTLSSNQCYIVTASRQTLTEATAFIRDWFPNRSGVRIFQSSNGWYGIVVATVSKAESDWRLNDFKARRVIPSDSYCSQGERFVAEIMRSSVGGGDGGSTRTMYVGDRVNTGLNLRTGPGGGIITEIPRGAQVSVLQVSNGWAQVRTSGGQTGWVSYSYLSASKPRAVQQASCTAYVTNLRPYSSATRADGSGFLNIRASASARSQILSETYLGDRMQVLSQSGNWAQVRCLSGQCQTPYRGSAGATGWASKKYLSIRCN